MTAREDEETSPQQRMQQSLDRAGLPARVEMADDQSALRVVLVGGRRLPFIHFLDPGEAAGWLKDAGIEATADTDEDDNVVLHLPAGLRTGQIAGRMGLRPGSVSRLLSRIGDKYGGGSSGPAPTHALLTARLIDPSHAGGPRTSRPRTCGCCVPTRSAPNRTTSPQPPVCPCPSSTAATRLLAAKGRARNITLLVAMGHPWGLLGTAEHAGDPR